MAREARYFVDEVVLLHFVLIVIAKRIPLRPMKVWRPRMEADVLVPDCGQINLKVCRSGREIPEDLSAPLQRVPVDR